MEKNDLIHKNVRVYYYYQFVYKLVYYNNKTENAATAFAARLEDQPPQSWFTHCMPLSRQRVLPTHRPALSRHAKPFFSAGSLVSTVLRSFLPGLLWKSRGISTGPDVQNLVFPAGLKICPSFVQAPCKLCTAGKRVCKSLILWSKRELSTEGAAFTIYYQFVYKL